MHTCSANNLVSYKLQSLEQFHSSILMHPCSANKLISSKIQSLEYFNSSIL